MAIKTAIRLAGKHPFFWVALLVGVLLLGFYVFAGLMIFRYGTLSKDFGWEYNSQGDKWYVSEVDPNGVAADKLQAGDRIIAVNNDEWITRIGTDVNLHLKLDVIPAETAYTVRIERAAAQHEYELTARLQRGFKNFARMIPLFFVSALFWILAILLGTLKPDQRLAQIAFIASASSAFLILGASLFSIDQFFQSGERLVYFWMFGLDTIGFGITYHLFHLFPSGPPPERVWTWIKRTLYVWGALQFIPRAFLHTLTYLGNQTVENLFANHQGPLNAYVRFDGALYAAAMVFLLIGIAAILAHKYRLLKDPDQRRRIKWTVYGTAAGALPGIVFFLSFVILSSLGAGYAPSNSNFQNLLALSNISAGAIPVTFGYAILKHRVFDINVVVRRSLQYLLAKNVLRVILSLPVIALAYAVVSNPNKTVAEILFHNSIYLYLMASVAVSLKYRRQLREWIDRKFFREAYDRERLLLGLVDDIKELDSLAEISRLVSNEVEAALHPKHIYAFYREEEKRDLALGYSSGGSGQNLRIPGSYRLLRLMESEANAQEYPLPQKDLLPQDERDWLDSLEISLIVPMNGTDSALVGLLLLAEKKSEEPYTPGDRKLLETIARQMAIVYENVWLKDRVDKERKIKREVLARLEDQAINLVKECPECGACFDSSAEFCETDHTELGLSLPVERTIEGKYRLDRLLGKGGMGAVYEATDLRLDRKVAIKIMLGSMFGDRTALRRFEREARASARLNHPNIITVYDYGVTGAEGAYLVMEMVNGFNIRSAIEKEHVIAPRVTAEWFEQVLEGMKAAHKSGIVHRDLKPENILISKAENESSLVKILDFGLAKVLQLDLSDQKTMTARGTVLGTFGYMSPEQLSGEDVDERSDIFAIGVMVVEALTGRRPFSGKSYAELLRSVTREPFQFPDDSTEGRRLNAVLQKCLAKKREDRFASMAELQRELIPAIRDCAPQSASAFTIADADTLIRQ
jgi:eukaryotic-like serine/threonine-protein kinase